MSRRGAYLGVDPTAASMHVGHLVPLMAQAWLYRAGHHAVSLVGGATVMIGDPSGRASARQQQTRVRQEENRRKIHAQVSRIWSNIRVLSPVDGGQHSILDNGQWLSKLPLLDLLTVLAPHVRVGPMLGRDYVRQRLHEGQGLSMAEFLYPLIQAWDWWHLHSQKDIDIQIGGADQFGNLLAGAGAVGHISNREPAMVAGFTVPLLTTAKGEKFGKSAGNAVWLDPALTSSFDLYQFFLGTPDDLVEQYLKLLTFEPLDEIDRLMHTQRETPGQRTAQHALAHNVLGIVHGAEMAEQAAQEHALVFRSKVGDASALPAAVARIARKDLDHEPLYKILARTTIVKSNAEGRTLCRDGLYVALGGLEFEKYSESMVLEDCLIDGRLVLRIGKQKIRVIDCVD